MTGATLPQSSPEWHGRFHARDLERLFEQTFAQQFHTRLCGGAPEPEYLPAQGQRQFAEIRYREDFYRSALHEIAHWCVAGPERREQPDFGYWYAPDGRDADQQQAFYRLEVRPQAFELVFCAAAAHPFAVSADNLDGEPGDIAAFQAEVVALARQLVAQPSPPERMSAWAVALSGFYRGRPYLPGLACLDAVLR